MQPNDTNSAAPVEPKVILQKIPAVNPTGGPAPFRLVAFLEFYFRARRPNVEGGRKFKSTPLSRSSHVFNNKS